MFILSGLKTQEWLRVGWLLEWAVTGLGFIGGDKRRRYEGCWRRGQPPKLADSIALQPSGQTLSGLFSTYVLKVIITAMSAKLTVSRGSLIICARSRSNSGALAARTSMLSTEFGALKAPRRGSVAPPGYKPDTPVPSYFQGYKLESLDLHPGRCDTPGRGTRPVVG